MNGRELVSEKTSMVRHMAVWRGMVVSDEVQKDTLISEISNRMPFTWNVLEKYLEFTVAWIEQVINKSAESDLDISYLVDDSDDNDDELNEGKTYGSGSEASEPTTHATGRTARKPLALGCI